MKEIIGLIAGKSGDSLTDEIHSQSYGVALVAGSDKDPGLDKADCCCVTDLRNREQILSFFREHGVKYFVIGTGTVLAFDLSDYLEGHGMVSSINTKASFLVKDKVKTKIAFSQIDVTSPRYAFFPNETYQETAVIEAAHSLTFPVVVKSNTDATQPVCAHDEAELSAAAARVIDTSTDLLLEEFIDGGDVTVCVSRNMSGTRPVGVIPYSKAKEYALEGFDHPYVYALTEQMNKELLDISERIVEHLGIIGIARIDYIIRDGVIYALEANSVIVTGYHGSAYPFFKAEGINIAKVSAENAISVFRAKGMV